MKKGERKHMTIEREREERGKFRKDEKDKKQGQKRES